MNISGDFLNTLLGAFFGATFALLTTMWLQRHIDRQSATLRFIEEFHSAEFLKHRISVSNLRLKVILGEVVIEKVASGYWYPGYQIMGSLDQRFSYEGEQLGDYNEHQHLTIFLGFLIRIAHASRKGKVDKSELAEALRTSYSWHGDFVTLLAETTKNQIAAYPGVDIPTWVKATYIVNEMLGYHPSQLMSQLKNPPLEKIKTTQVVDNT